MRRYFVAVGLSAICVLVQTSYLHAEAKSSAGSFLSTSQIPSELIEKTFPSPESLWHRYYSAGATQLRERKYDAAEKSLIDSIKEAKNSRGHADELALSRTALGTLYCQTHRTKEAEGLFSYSLALAKRNNDYQQIAENSLGLALVNLNANQGLKSRTFAEEAINAFEAAHKKDSSPYGQSITALARALGASNLMPEADSEFQHGLAILAEHPGYHELDYADGLREAALFAQSAGDAEKARALFEQSYAIKDKSVDLAHPTNLNGCVEFDWENGSPRSLEFPDVDVPLRFITAGDARISGAVVDLWELFGILISITNTSDHQITVGVTSATLLAMPARTKLELVDPNRIDHIRRERQIWDITYKHPWLANIQKTRTMRGFVPAQGHDLYRGPNVFGLYGAWDGTPRILPDKFALELSPEHLSEQADAPYDPSIIHSAEANFGGQTTFTLEPFESRTGVLFYMNPRCENVIIKVPIGNTLCEIPFKCRKRRISSLPENSVLSLASRSVLSSP